MSVTQTNAIEHALVPRPFYIGSNGHINNDDPLNYSMTVIGDSYQDDYGANDLTLSVFAGAEEAGAVAEKRLGYYVPIIVY